MNTPKNPAAFNEGPSGEPPEALATELPEPTSGFPDWNPDPEIQPGEQARAFLLMQYFDGELDAAAVQDLESELSDDELAQLEALSFSEEMLSESVESDSRGDSISQGVMAALAEQVAMENEAVVTSLPTQQATRPAVSEDRTGLAKRRAANDNARSIWALAAAAAAVAAGLFVWGKTEPVADYAASRVALPASAQAPSESSAMARNPLGIGKGVAAGAGAAMAGHGLAGQAEDDGSNVEVDFGSHRGSVFLVGSGNSTAAMSAVVWVTDGDE